MKCFISVLCLFLWIAKSSRYSVGLVADTESRQKRETGPALGEGCDCNICENPEKTAKSGTSLPIYDSSKGPQRPKENPVSYAEEWNSKEENGKVPATPPEPLIGDDGGENYPSEWTASYPEDTGDGTEGEQSKGVTERIDHTVSFDQCNCVSVIKCGILYKVYSKPEESPCGEDEVCCETSQPEAESQDEDDDNDQETTSSSSNDDSSENESPPVIPIRNLRCGESKPDPSIRGSESGSDRASYGEFPWTVLITHTEKNNKFRCSGTLVRDDIVLTSANCVFNYDFDQLIVHGGAWDLATPSSAQIRTLDTYIVHPSFKFGKSLSNNIALLRLAKPFHLSTDINIICLAPSLNDVDLKSCVANGWGSQPGEQSSKQAKQATVMKKVWLPFIAPNQCQEKIQRYTTLGKSFRLGQGLFCAGGEKGVDMCRGDGGGPLLCPSRSSSAMAQVGIIAGGVSCGKQHVPGFYTDVTYFNSWIKDNIATLDSL